MYAHSLTLTLVMHDCTTCSKTTTAARSMSAQFSANTVKKRYRAIVVGEIPDSGSIFAPVDGKEAFTTYASVLVTQSLKFG
jgi:23S rRNA-/tRNA-specific pseudouridylate synthase